MHLIASWQILPRPQQRVGIAPGGLSGGLGLGSILGDDSSSLDAEMLGVLAPYPWVRPLPSFYIVQAANSLVVETIKSGLIRVASKYPDRIHVIISPPMSGGQYAGRLPNNLWPEINKRAT